MYTAGGLVLDYTSNQIFSREILDPKGEVICHVIEAYGDETGTKDLLAHLNRVM